MNKLIIGGVPEHFNLPVKLLWEEREPVIAELGAEWEEFPGGSGAMLSALADRKLDVALLLTEAAVAAKAAGGDLEIVSLYTQTPLLWGIHVPAGSDFADMDSIEGARYAISRIGSGSHLISYALTRSKGWPTADLEFVEVGSLDGAIAAFAQKRADVFLWEKIMTKPLVDAGTFRRVGEFAAPWPGFVVCVSGSKWSSRGIEIRRLVEAALLRAARMKADPSAPAQVAQRYGLQLRDAKEWLEATRWAERFDIEEGALGRVREVLRELGLIDEPFE